jgi:hypothetical protein
MMTTTTTSTAAPATGRPIERRFERRDHSKPRIPFRAHLRELEMCDGRKLLLDRRSIAFLCEGKPEEFGGKKVTVVAFKTMAKACPVVEAYGDLKSSWGADGANGKVTS